MDDLTPEDLEEVLRPLVSLISKSEKAQQKLKPGTWQHTMLSKNLKALHLAVALMTGGEAKKPGFTRDELEESVQALGSMIGKAEKAQAKFALGTSHHTLQSNRLRALRSAEARVKAELAEGSRGD